MNENKIFKILCSIPVILITLYFIPFIGVILILFRYYVYRNEKYYKTPLILLICGLLLLIPRIVNSVIKILKFNVEDVPYLKVVLDSDIYLKLLSYSRYLIIVSIIFLIISFIFRNTISKINGIISSQISNYGSKLQEDSYKIRKENDLIMQEKRERAQNTHVVYCPYCGSDNMLTEKTGTCKFCRRKIEYKE